MLVLMASTFIGLRQTVICGHYRSGRTWREARSDGRLQLDSGQPCSSVGSMAGHTVAADAKTEPLRPSVVDMAAAGSCRHSDHFAAVAWLRTFR